MKGQLLNKIIFILLLFPVHLFAQPAEAGKDITGLWKGSLYNDSSKKTLPYEIAISEEGGKLTGYSYTLFDIDGRQEMGVKKIKLKRKDDQIFIEDIELISNTYSEPPPKGVRFRGVVNLSVHDSTMELTGKWSTNRTREYFPNAGSVQLQKKIDFKPQALFKVLTVLKLDNDLSFVKDQKKASDIAMNEKKAPVNNSPVSPTTTAIDIDKPKEAKAAVPIKTVPVVESKPANEIKPVEQPVAKLPVEKPVIAVAAVPEIILTKIIIKDLSAIKNKPSSELALVPAYKSKSIITALTDKRKEIFVAANVIKKEIKQPPVEVAKATTPPPVDKKPAPIVAVKEPVKKPVAIDKPKPVPPPVVVNKPAPVTAIKEPVKTENKTPVVVVAPPEPKKDAVIAVAVPMPRNVAVDVAERKMKNEQSVFFESDSLVLTLYDNGDVDGDTVSVLMNGQIIFARQGLSTKANSKTIYIDKSMPDTVSMVMYAENLGSIPPNTGLLIIMDGEKRYEVRFSADLKTNAAILLRRRIKGT